MNSWSWVSNTLKNLKLTNVSTSQSRSPPLFSAVPASAVPPKPKKPLTPYFRFLSQVRENVKKENPTLKPTELMKKIAVGWDKLDESNKSRYVSEYKKDMESYMTILQKYQQSLTPEQKELGHQLKLEKQIKKEKREKRKRVKELGKPKKPLSSFLAFLKTKVAPGASIADHQSAAKNWAVKWKTMPEAEKNPFLLTYQEELQKYEKDLLKWEEKMIKQGNEDLVRQSQLNKLAPKMRKSQ